MAALVERKTPFDLRLRENQYVQREAYAEMTIATIAQRLKPGEKLFLKDPRRLGRGAKAPTIRPVILRLASGELLALATSANPRNALARYRARWRIECLFATLKSKGFDLEATHLTGLVKLSTLMALLALAAKSGVAAHRRKAIPIKKHGRAAQSLFALGRAILCKTLASPNPTAIAEFLRQILAQDSATPPLKHVQV